MTEATPILWRARLEQFLLALLLGVLAAVLANFALVYVLDQLKLVSNPNDLNGFLLGTALMSAVGIAAVLSLKPLLTGIMSAILFGGIYGFIAWNADKFVEVLPLTACATLIPLLTAGIAGSAHFLMRRLRT